MPQRSMKVQNADNLKSDINCNYFDPTICPLCDHALVPKALSGFCVLDENTAHAPAKMYDVYLIFFCPNCRKIFMTKYRASLPQGALSLTCGSVTGVYPRSAKATTFSEEIAHYSPRFVTIYNQAEFAEANNLNEIVGSGYRRALEFLVKDYLCQKNPDAAEVIKGELLGNSLKRIDDKRIQLLATKATWLGNDATHYVWKHEDYDVDDLKRFINAMLRYIESELAFDAALDVPYVK